MTADAAAMTNHAVKLSRECQRVLHGQGAMIQAAVLADLMSLWLAGHIARDDFGNLDKVTTAVARNALLKDWLATVRDLVPESEKEILARAATMGGRH